MKTRMLNGYRVVYDPDHPSAMQSRNWKGYIYEHVKVAESMMKRSLSAKEEVHHLNMDKTNNRFDNLLVLEKSQHTKLHNWIRNGALGTRVSGLNGVNSGKPKLAFCKNDQCRHPLAKGQSQFCSKRCAGLDPSRRKVVRPEQQVLAKDIARLSWTKIGEKYGVSDNAVRKWARFYGLIRQS